MRRIDAEDLDLLEETGAVLRRRGFTGRVVEAEETGVTARTFVNGVASGPDIAWNSDGRLVSLGNLATGGLPVGPSHHWDAEGRLVGEERHRAQFGRFDPATGEQRPAPWL
ncbi:hypothetical protein ABZ234_23870 [Nocardiopsis sp. NPDC006198]|uniref:hypothetical protein n=1 Tax=Nocardiopsis sp. NPDC006198 TaxID=3154472 RepID=UPI0033B7ACF6